MFYIWSLILIFSLSGCSDIFLAKTQRLHSVENVSVKNKDTMDSFKIDRDLIETKNKNYIITNNETVSSILKKIGERDNEYYILTGDLDYKLKDTTFKINKLEDLQYFLEQTTDYKLICLSKIYEKVQKFKLIYKNNSLLSQKLPVMLSEDKTLLGPILYDVAKELSYSLIIDSSVEKDFFETEEKVYFYGETIGDFFKYVQNKKNVFIDIDEDNLLIQIKKFKTLVFDIPINVPNIQIANGMQSKGGGGSLGSSKASSNTQYSLDLFKELEDYLKILLTQGNETDVSPNRYFIQRSTNKVFINTDYLTQIKVSNIISDFVSDLQTMINVHVSLYNVSKKEENQAGISWTNVFKQLQDVSLELETANGTDGTTQSPISFKYRNKYFNFDAFLNVLGEYGNVQMNREFDILTNNNIPTLYSATTTTAYVKAEDVSYDENGNKTIERKVENVEEGMFYFVNAKVLKDTQDIMLMFTPTFADLVKFEGVGEGTDSVIKLPTMQIETYTQNITLKDGDTLLLTALSEFQNNKNYDGLDSGFTKSDYARVLTGQNSTANNLVESFILITVKVIR